MASRRVAKATHKRPSFGFVVLVYRMPAKPTAGRVAVWRHLKKVGAIYLQQSVCVFPATLPTRRKLDPILSMIQQSGGEYHLLPLRLSATKESDKLEYAKLVDEFVAQTSRHYQ